MLRPKTHTTPEPGGQGQRSGSALQNTSAASESPSGIAVVVRNGQPNAGIGCRSRKFNAIHGMLELREVNCFVCASYVGRLQELLAPGYLAIGGRNGIFSGEPKPMGEGEVNEIRRKGAAVWP